MKKLYFLLFAVLISFSATGQVIIAEDFSYPDGSLVPNGGWANISGTLGDLLVSSGQAVVRLGPSSEDAEIAFSSVVGDIYAGFDFSVDDLGSPYVGTDNEYFAHLDFDGRMDVVAPSGAGDFSVGISSSTSTAQATWAADLTFGQTYRAIIKVDQTTGTAQLWIDAVLETDTSISGTADGATTITSFDLRQSGSSENETVRVDNLMVGQTFDDVVTFSVPTDPTLILVGEPSSGGTVDLGPEDLTGDLEFATTNFVVGEPGTGTEGDGYITWSLDVQGGGNHDSGVVYDTSITYPFIDLNPNLTYLFTSELLDNAGASLAPPVTYNLTINTLGYIVVSDIAALRADVTTNGSGLYYEITGAVLVTHTDSFRNRHWIQDSNISGILIYDQDGIIAPAYNVGDNVTGLKGQTTFGNGVLRFNPSTNSGVVASSGNPVVPQVLTILTYTSNYEDYESEFVEFQNVSFVEGDGVATFATGTNYTVTDGANNVVKRTDFFTADYIGTVIPSGNLSSLEAVTGEFNGTPQIYVRTLADFTLSNESFNVSEFKLFPNPNNTGTLSIMTNGSESIIVKVFDVLGKKIIDSEVVNNNLDVSRLNAGLYIVKLTQGNATVTKKLIIE